jgi:uncharacterized membrane protein YphA (DoxX/SURF4 family)
MLRFGGTADFLLRLGVAFAFLYPPANAILDPYAWIGYFPAFLDGLMPDQLLLHVFGLVEVVIGLWILSGRNIFIPCLVAFGLLVLIVVFNLGDFQVLFRDVSIALMALALAVAHRPQRAS